ncbi:MAG: hypothetical protein WKF81_08270 [Thermomicrobiales bacterium]
MHHDNPPIQPGTSQSGISARFICGFAAVALILSLLGLVVGSNALAQDGTGAATPTPPTNCVVPPVTVVDGPREDEQPLIPFLTTPEASPQASPVASSPVASLELDITQLTRVLANCLSENRLDTVVSLTGDEFRGQLLGVNEGIDGATYTAIAETLPVLPYAIVSVEEIRGTGRGQAEALVTYTIGRQMRAGIWSFDLVNTGFSRKWVVVSEEPQVPVAPADTPSIAVDISDNSYELDPDTATGTSVQLLGTNSDEGDHEMLVIELGIGVSIETLLTTPGPELPDGIEFVGQLTIPGGSEGTLILTGLEPGTYTIVCLLSDEEGVPHLSTGMQTTFTVE